MSWYLCDCRTPAEHAEHLRQEQALRNRLFPVEIQYTIVLESGETVEVTKEEFFSILRKEK